MTRSGDTTSGRCGRFEHYHRWDRADAKSSRVMDSHRVELDDTDLSPCRSRPHEDGRQRHGPHHVAQKSTSTGVSDFRTSCSKLWSLTTCGFPISAVSFVCGLCCYYHLNASCWPDCSTAGSRPRTASRPSRPLCGSPSHLRNGSHFTNRQPRLERPPPGRAAAELFVHQAARSAANARKRTSGRRQGSPPERRCCGVSGRPSTCQRNTMGLGRTRRSRRNRAPPTPADERDATLASLGPLTDRRNRLAPNVFR